MSETAAPAESAPPAPPPPENTPARDGPPPIPKRKRGRPPKNPPPPEPPPPQAPPPPPPEPLHPVKVMLLGEEATFEVSTPALVIGGLVTGAAEKVLARRTGRALSPEQRQAGKVAHALCADKYGITLAKWMPEAMLCLFWLDIITAGPQGERLAAPPPAATEPPQAQA